jgi:hypothetical protein
MLGEEEEGRERGNGEYRRGVWLEIFSTKEIPTIRMHVPPGGSSMLGKLAISRRSVIIFAWLGRSAAGVAAAAVDVPPADSPLRLLLLLLLLAFLRAASKTRQRLPARSAKITYCFRVSVLSAERFFFSRLLGNQGTRGEGGKEGGICVSTNRGEERALSQAQRHRDTETHTNTHKCTHPSPGTSSSSSSSWSSAPPPSSWSFVADLLATRGATLVGKEYLYGNCAARPPRA